MLIAVEKSEREFLIDPDGADCHETCIQPVCIQYFWEEEDDSRTLLATIHGTLVHVAQMDEDPAMVCDDEDQDLGYVTRVTLDEVFDTLFYLEEYQMEKRATFPVGNEEDIESPKELLQLIIDSLPDTLLRLDGVKADVIAVYPAALPWVQDELTKKRRNLAMEALRQKMNAIAELHPPLEDGEPGNRIVYSMTNGYDLTEDDVNYFMGIAGGYPEQAKNEAEFRMWEQVGFSEIGNSRVMILDDDDDEDDWDEDGDWDQDDDE